MNRSSLYTIFLIIERSLGLLLTLFLLRYISAPEYVIWGQNIAIAAIGFQFLLFGTNESIIKYFPTWSKAGNIQGNIIFLIMSMSILFLVLFASTIFLFSDQLTKLAYGAVYKKEYLIILLVFLAGEAYLYLVTDLLRSKKQILRSSFYKFSFNFFRVGILIASLSVFELDFYNSLVVYSIYTVIFILFILFFELKNFKFSPVNFSEHLDNFKKILNFGIPTMIATFFLLFHIYFDRFILAMYLDIKTLSNYILNSNIALNSTFIANLVGFALYPALSNRIKSHKSDQLVDIFVKYLLFFFGLIIPFLIMIYYFYPHFYYLYGSREFLIDRLQMLMLLIGYSLYGLYIIFSYLVYVFKGSKFSIKVTFFGMITNALLNLLLIPEYEIYGAALSLLVSFLFIVIYTKTISNTFVRWDFPWRKITYILLRSLVLIIPIIISESIGVNFLTSLIVFAITIFIYLLIDYLSKFSFYRCLIFERKK